MIYLAAALVGALAAPYILGYFQENDPLIADKAYSLLAAVTALGVVGIIGTIYSPQHALLLMVLLGLYFQIRQRSRVRRMLRTGCPPLRPHQGLRSLIAAAVVVILISEAVLATPIHEPNAMPAIRIWISGSRRVSTFVSVLQDEAGSRHHDGWEALTEARPATAVPYLIPLLRNGDKNVRRQAAETLGEFGPSGALAVPALLTALTDSDQAVRQGAEMALGEMGPLAMAAVPSLLDLKKSGNRQTGPAAADALDKIRGPALNPMMLLLRSDDSSYRRSAAKRLGEMGRTAASTVPALLPLQNDPDPGVRQEVTEALQKIGPPEEPVRLSP